LTELLREIKVKGKGKEKQHSEVEDEDEREEGMIKCTISASIRVTKGSLDNELADAMIGFAKVNLLSPLKPIFFGSFNSRPIDNKSVQALVANMEFVGVQSDRYENAIPLLVNPGDIDLSSIERDITDISQAPDLKLTNESVEMFQAAGGRHRMEAVKVLNVRLEEKIEVLRRQIERLKIKKSNKNNERRQALTQDLKILEAKMAGLGWWTVILYNKGKVHLTKKFYGLLIFIYP